MLRHCCHQYGKSGEIALLREIYHNSVAAHRNRLRTKLGLNKEQNLNDYLQSIVDRRKVVRYLFQSKNCFKKSH